MRYFDYYDENGKHSSSLNSLPKLCSFCNTSTAFEIRYCRYNTDKHIFNFFLECAECNRFSIYTCSHLFEPIDFIPHKVCFTPASESIAKLSPSFAEIYKQSQLAENSNLLEICGMGYRKALEFLIKDYLIKNSESKDKVLNETLNQSIQRIASEQIKTVAERVAWLGNDQTHYIKKHTDKDLSDLKLFLDTVIKYIELELNYLAAKRETACFCPNTIDISPHVTY